MTKLEWLRRYRTEQCPNCSGKNIKNSLVKTTAICPDCNRIWAVRRATWTWHCFWYFEDKQEPKADQKYANNNSRFTDSQ